MALGKKFRTSTRMQAKASIMIEGLTGKGKSGLALAFARAFASSWDKIYAIDTENMALDLFVDIPMHTGEKFGSINKVDLTAEDGYAPSNYKALCDEAIASGAEVVIMDSYSHCWTRQGGVLDKLSKVEIKGNTNKNNNYTAWNDAEVSKEKNLIFELVRNSKAHIITTVRSKEKFALELNEAKGKNEVVSLGEQQIQQDGLKYEPDLVLRMVSAGNTKGKAPIALVIKSRYAILEEGIEYEFTDALLKQVASYLAEGTSPEVLLEQQKQDYIDAIKEYCTGNKTRTSIWRNIKEAAGYKDSKIDDIPLEALRPMFIQLTSD